MELIQAAFLPANLFFTLIFLLVCLYWLSVILGALDLDFLDIDLDTDSDLDVDADGDVDIGAPGAGFFEGLLAFFYFGKIPVMILLSITVLCMWTISMYANSHFNPKGTFVLGIPVAIGTIIASPIICKIICMPLARFFGMFKKDYHAPRDVKGRICKVITTQVSEKMGQAEVPTKGAPILLNVVANGDHVFHKGDEAVVVEKDEEKGVYVIAPVNLED